MRSKIRDMHQNPIYEAKFRLDLKRNMLSEVNNFSYDMDGTYVCDISLPSRGI